MTPAPPEWADAEVFTRPMGAGRNKPVSVLARRSDDVLVECVIKPAARLAMPPLEYLLEWLGAVIGRALDLNVPAPLAVRVTSDFAASVDDAEVRAILGRSTGVTYGSTFEKGFTQIPSGFSLSPTLREEAARVLAFDVFVHNVDRRLDNANLFIDRDRFLAFDHEQAFSFVFPIIGGRDPVSDDCPEIVSRHVLRPLLLGVMPSLKAFEERLRTLDDAFFAGLLAATPAEWTAGPALGKIENVLEVLQRRRDAAGQWLPKVEAWMAR